MTCIVGIEHDGVVTLAADSRLSDMDSHIYQNMVSTKVWTSGEWVYGGCGSLRGLQILRYIFAAPQLPDEDDADTMEEYLVNYWSEELRETFSDAGHQKMKHEVQTTPNTWFMFGIRGRLYLMMYDYAVYRIDRGFQAVGSGEQYALGALEALKGVKMHPQDKLTAALDATSAFCPSVGPPYHYVTTV